VLWKQFALRAATRGRPSASRRERMHAVRASRAAGQCRSREFRARQGRRSRILPGMAGAAVTRCRRGGQKKAGRAEQSRAQRPQSASLASRKGRRCLCSVEDGEVAAFMRYRKAHSFARASSSHPHQKSRSAAHVVNAVAKRRWIADVPPPPAQRPAVRLSVPARQHGRRHARHNACHDCCRHLPQRR